MSQIQSSTPTPAVTSASPTPKPTMAAPELEVGAIVATGHLAGDPLVVGDVEVVVARAGAFELRLLDFRSDHPGEIGIGLSPRTVDPGTRCTSSIMTTDYGDPFQYTELAFPLDPDFTDGDPTFLRTVLVKLYDPAATFRFYPAPS
jgi:hypothetical protein